jgi:hypothetical protein
VFTNPDRGQLISTAKRRLLVSIRTRAGRRISPSLPAGALDELDDEHQIPKRSAAAHRRWRSDRVVPDIAGQPFTLRPERKSSFDCHSSVDRQLAYRGRRGILA